MNFKVALLMFVAFASVFTATAVAFSISTPTAYGTVVNTVETGSFLFEPLGDPIDGPTPPHGPT